MSTAASPTSKTVGGIAGWLTGSITLPAAAGGTLTVVNTSIEEIVAVFS